MIKITDNIDFKIFDFPVGVCVSGGADSALMMYFVLKYTSHPVHIFTFAASDKFLKNPITTIKVISKCAELTGNYNFQHHISYGESQNKENLFELPGKYLTDDIIKAVYTGVTKNPPFEVTSKFFDEDTETNERNPAVVRENFLGNWYRPWTNLDKQDIFSIYKHYNLHDTLLPITRSCEWVGYKKHGKDPGLKHCGKCWWCQEREWGLKILNEQ
jgi:7-cyano-7-deazaguanine synthase in queuosine biosynthesis